MISLNFVLVLGLIKLEKFINWAISLLLQAFIDGELILMGSYLHCVIIMVSIAPEEHFDKTIFTGIPGKLDPVAKVFRHTRG